MKKSKLPLDAPAWQKRDAHARHLRPLRLLLLFKTLRRRRLDPDRRCVWIFDPMYSSGVFLALKSAEMAADCVIEAFEKKDFSAHQLSKWGQPLADGMQSLRKLVYAFYTKGFFLRPLHPRASANQKEPGGPAHRKCLPARHR
jgi:hypothetical protein